jgi:hypothetical protein
MNLYTRFLRSRTKIGRPVFVRPEVELLEARNLLSAPPTNVLVNNPAEDTIPMQDTQSETAIVLGSKSNAVVAYNDTGLYSYPTPLNPNLLGYSLSTNGGTSFTDEGQPQPNPPYWQGTDPALARSSKTGTIFLSSTSGNTDLPGVGERVLVSRSLDNGATFAPPLDGSPGFVLGVDRVDKPWIAVDNYPGPGYGNVYLVWTDFQFKNNGSLTDKGIFFTRSTDDGQTWGPSGSVPIAVQPQTGVQDAWVTVGPDHSVFVIWWFGEQSQEILMSKSTDQGQTFSAPVVVTGLRTNGGLGDLGLTYSNTNSSTFHTSVIPQAAVNPVTGDIYVVYPDKPKNPKDNADIFLTMSTDGGSTWSNPLRVNDDATTTDQWNPAIAMTPDGTHLFITWYDRRNDPTNNSLIDRYGVIGTISGHTVSFAPNFGITDVSFPPAFGQDSLFLGAGDTRYMGDYDQAVADNNYFYTTWGDNRRSDAFFANQPDVRFAKIPVEGETDPSLVLGAARILAGTFAVGLTGNRSFNDPAPLLVGLMNSMAATTRAHFGPTPLDGSSNPNSQPAPVLLPLAPIDMSTNQGAGSTISPITPAMAMKAQDMILAEDGDAGLSDGMALGVIGS